VTADNSRIDALIKQNQQVKTLELCDAVGIAKPAVIRIVHDFGHKTCVLTDQNQEARKVVSTDGTSPAL
jgi:hypothetical protein